VTGTGTVIDADAVSVRYGGGEREAVAFVNLSLAKGETLVVVGPNGAGKSTLLRVLAGTLRPTSGAVRLFGAPLHDMPRRDVAKQLAFVTQSEDVRFSFSVREVVMMGRAPHQGSRMRASDADDKLVDQVLRDHDLDSLADRSVAELSGGEKKRVAVARAFAQTTPVLLLDEPTASLDLPHQVKLFHEISRRARDEGAVCVVVTHDLMLAASYASRVLLMKRGRTVALGPRAEVLSSKNLSEAFDWPIEAVVATSHAGGVPVFLPRRDIGDKSA
jgi:iron complex transport system ATP-binding protein